MVTLSIGWLELPLMTCSVMGGSHVRVCKTGREQNPAGSKTSRTQPPLSARNGMPLASVIGILLWTGLQARSLIWQRQGHTRPPGTPPQWLKGARKLFQKRPTRNGKNLIIRSHTTARMKGYLGKPVSPSHTPPAARCAPPPPSPAARASPHRCPCRPWGSRRSPPCPCGIPHAPWPAAGLPR